MAPSRSPDRGLIVQAVATLLIGVVILWTLYSIRGALLVIYVSALLALGFTPIVRSLERQRFVGAGRLPRWIAILVLYFGLLGIAGAVVAVMLPPLVRQASALGRELPNDVLRLQSVLASHGLLDHRWTVDEVLTKLPGPSAALSVALGALQSVFGAVGTVVAILVLPYYLLVEGDSLESGLLGLFPLEHRPLVARIARHVTFKVGAWLNGQLLLSAIIGVTTSVGLWLLGVPYFYVLGLIAALGEFIPIIGPIVAAAPAILLALTQSVHSAVFVTAYFGVQQFIEGNILVPRVMERQVGVRAWSVIVALLIGSELLGVVGALLAVPSAAIVQVLIEAYLDRDSD
jgi:predicted PurR-regulated permease PerM